jgi:exodeoxyribonuclease VII large subunit
VTDQGTLDLFGGDGGAEAPPASRPATTTPLPPLEHTSTGPADRSGAPADRSPPPEPPVLTVSQVNRAVRNLLERELDPLWISGEVANWTKARSGHCYLTLKDDQAQLRCVIWRRDADRLPMDLEDGMKIRGFGQLTLYEGRGEFQFGIREVSTEEGEGLWRLAFERLRRALEAEGLLDPARRRPIPRFPRTVGVVTSVSGAALRDIVSVIRRRAPWTRVVVRGARVQGEGAAAEVADAIRILAGSGLADVLIVGRGGGSIEDLWAFNEEVVARAIVASPVPVISAVGHEVDVTIADLVADLRAPTPSAGAEAAVQDGEAILELLRRLRPRLARGLRTGVEARRLRLGRQGDRLQTVIRRVLEPGRARLERQGERLVRAGEGLVAPRRERGRRLRESAERAVGRIIEARRARLAELAGRVETLSPLSTLQRGYAVPLSPQGRLLRLRKEFPVGARFSLRVSDGRVACTSLGPEQGETTGGG